MKPGRKALAGAATIVFLALLMRACNMVALSSEFSEPDFSIGDRSFRVRPVALVDAAGSKLGIPRYEMKDTFFVNISYECRSKIDGVVEVLKDGTVTSASDVYPSGRWCYMTFRSSSPMSGVFTIRFTSSGGSYEREVLLERELMFKSPLIDMIMSA